MKRNVSRTSKSKKSINVVGAQPTTTTTVAEALGDADVHAQEERLLLAVVRFLDEHMRRCGEPPQRQIFVAGAWKNVNPEIVKPLRLELILRAGDAMKKRDEILHRFVDGATESR